jgi:muramoyltetrapeptide carboxypeptidase
MNQLQALKRGDTIGIFAPGSPTKRELVEQGTRWLESEGYRVLIPSDPSANYGRKDGSFCSASVQERIQTLSTLLNDKDVRAILCARGAYGSAEILPSIDFDQIRTAGKAIIGYSDVTALIASIPTRAGIAAIHGSTLTKEFAEAESSEDAKKSATAVLALLQGEPFSPLKGETMRDGAAEGRLLVGNLTVLVSLLGTPYEPDFRGSVLVLEEVGESPYRVHRMLMQLLLAGKLNKIAALCLGRFLKCEGINPPTLEDTLKRFLSDHLKDQKYPVIAGLQVGHGGINSPLPCGLRARVQAGELSLLEPVVRMR